MTVDQTLNPYKRKDPTAVLDYFIDWADWLTEGDSLVTAVWTITGPDSLLVQSTPAPSIVGGRAIIWLTGGTLDAKYEVTCHITTAQGREDDRTLLILVRDN